ncbi:MAG: isoprenylcysteine carboxylmethyltransferase family protein [Oscillospiraceae bacterium]|nr:isoprenylcysteine carboxylmethyltransferase family protein [Oscillospiraceae bacterium]
MKFNLFGISWAAYIFSTVITLSVVAVFAAVAVDFIKYGGGENAVKKSRRSIVATGSMAAFYAVYFAALRFGAGALHLENIWAAILGTAMIAAGAAVNISGRIQLGGNWANHIKIYKGHHLVDCGVYRIARHPLYSSLMLMLFGGSVAYTNWMGAVLTAFVFIPFMYYRARQEETLLREEFAGYEGYMESTGMFFPKIWKIWKKGGKKDVRLP